MDPLALASAVLQSSWLLPVLVLMIAIDGPLPVLPSETVLMSGVATATVLWDVPMLAGLFLAAGTGSMLGDLAAYNLGRGSHRMLPRRRDDRYGVARWVRANLFRRPVASLAAARFVPGGRLVSTAAAGRMRLPSRLFLAGSLVSSTLWSSYMLVVGLVLGPVTGGNPLLCVLAGAGMAVLTTGGFALARRLRSGLPHRAPGPRLAPRYPVSRWCPAHAGAPGSAGAGRMVQRTSTRRVVVPGARTASGAPPATDGDGIGSGMPLHDHR